MTSPELPVRPIPYIAVGNGWTVNVSVPGYGTWKRDPSKVSITYSVYNKTNSAYHITIDSSYISKPANPNPSAPMNAHISSNTTIGTKVLHWPNPGLLTPEQQDWMDLYNDADQFDDLIDAFKDRMERCAENVKLSREYDAAMVEYGKQRLAGVAQSRQAKESFEEELADSVDVVFPPEAYQPGFQKDGKLYFLDLNRGEILALGDKPRLVRNKDGLNPGFINLCGDISGGKVVPLTAEKWGKIQAGLVLLLLRDIPYVMSRSDFDACVPATTLLSLDQVVDQAVTAWTEDMASSKVYKVVATDNTLMNVTSPDSVRCHLKTADLLDVGALTRLGISEAKKKTDRLEVFSGQAGVHDISCVAELQAELPEVVRVSSGGRPYIVPELLVEGWSTELQKASTVDATALAADLLAKGAGCQLFAENLMYKDKSQLAVYLLGLDGSGSAYYLGPKDDVVPNLKAAGNKPLDLKDGQRVRSYFGNGLSSTVVASAPDAAIVICGANRKSLTPPLFVPLKRLKELDLTAAREAYAAMLQQKKEAEKVAAAKEKATALADEVKYANAWKIIEPRLGSGAILVKLYEMGEGTHVAVRDDDRRGVVDGTLLETVTVTTEDKKLSARGSKTYRYISFECTDSSEGWFKGMMDYITKNKPKLPTGFGGCVVRRKEK